MRGIIHLLDIFAKEFGQESEAAREADGLILCELPTLPWLGQ